VNNQSEQKILMMLTKNADSTSFAYTCIHVLYLYLQVLVVLYL